MGYFTMDDAEYWEVPGRLAPLQGNREALDEETAGGAGALELARQFRSTQFVLGDPDDDDTPGANVIVMPPGFGLARHTHPCDVFMLVLKGSLYVPGKVLRPGDGMTARAHEFYGPEVAGPEGCTRVEFFAAMRGFLEVEYRRRDGQEVTVEFLRDFPPPNREIEGVEVMRELIRAARGQQETPPAAGSR